jgi:AbrB family looped-hinge helix DNA binding protein
MTTLLIGARGTVTLPAAMRALLGIKPGGVVIAEQRGGEIVLKPARVVEEAYWDDEKIARILKAVEPDEALYTKLEKKFGMAFTTP